MITTLRVLHRGGVGIVAEPAREVTEQVLHLGRDADVQLCFDSDLLVSRRHATLRCVGGQLLLRDGVDTSLSKHGTFVNNTQLSAKECPLSAGDVIRIGHSFLHVGAWPVGLNRATSLPEIRGESPEMYQLRAKVLALAVDRDADGILILGETGTGKELVAQQLHARSPRSAGPLIIADLGRVPAGRESFLSELFGHVKGAYTGATADRKGCFEEARGGTIFLDELGELPAELQPALLRALETKTIRKLGAPSRPLPVDVRVIAATNRDIDKEVKAGEFRSDLYGRLQKCIIQLSPLRSRREDILPIVAEGLGEMAKLALDPDLVSALMFYSWPRNRREAFAAGQSLAREARDRNASRLTQEMAPSWLSPSEPAPASQAPSPSAAETAEPRASPKVSEQRLKELLAETQGQISEVARLLGSNRKYVYRRLAEYQIDYARFRRGS